MLTLLQRFAGARAVLGRSRRWTQLWLLVVVLRRLRRMRKGRPQVAFSYEIRPGDTLLIAGDGPEPRIVGGR